MNGYHSVLQTLHLTGYGAAVVRLWSTLSTAPISHQWLPSPWVPSDAPDWHDTEVKQVVTFWLQAIITDLFYAKTQASSPWDNYLHVNGDYVRV
jgi:hypothetical protein